jgi:hypothetical protein
MTAWTNSDGLKVKFGLDESKKAKEGMIPSANGTDKTIEADIVGVDLTATSATLNGGGVHSVVIPAGALIRRATLITEVAFTSGGSATLNLGLKKISDDTELDHDGIDATIALTAIDAVGETVTCDGALVAGVALTADAYLVADYDTAAYTAGRAKLIIEIVMPDA